MGVEWSAGFFEGEGSVGWTSPDRTCQRRYLRLAVTQVRREPLERFIEGLGFGSISGPYTDKRSTRQPFHQVHLTGKSAEKAWELMSPYLTEATLDKYARALAKEVV